MGKYIKKMEEYKPNPVNIHKSVGRPQTGNIKN